jgi:hypothetical protein
MMKSWCDSPLSDYCIPDAQTLAAEQAVAKPVAAAKPAAAAKPVAAAKPAAAKPAAAAQPMSVTFKKGDRVRMVNLVGQKDFNGRFGNIISELIKGGPNDGRYEVKLDKINSFPSCIFAYKPTNLELVPPEFYIPEEDSIQEEACSCYCCLQHEQEIMQIEEENIQLEEENRQLEEENRQLTEAQSSLFPLLNEKQAEIAEKDALIAKLMKELEELKASSSQPR